MWRLSIDDDQANRTVVDLVRDEYSIGRAEDNAVCLTERNVSRHHAKLKREDDGWILLDLESYNGCFVGGERVKSQHTVVPGEAIVVGDYRLRVADAAQESVVTPDANATVPAGRPSISPIREDRLVMLSGPRPGLQMPLRGARLRVGRGEECDVRLDDTSVSRVHAGVEQLTDGVFQIRDEASSNGIRINGREVQEAVLTPGDVLELGDVELVFVPKGQAFDLEAFRARTTASPARLLARVKRNPKLMLSAAAGAVVFGAVLIGLTSTRGEVAHPPKSPAATALDTAERQMKEGQVEVAHETLKAIGPDSNLRQSGRYREIELRWADDQFARAQRAQDATEERHILERIARAPGVDTLRRKRAADLLELLAESNLQPSDLPGAAPDAGSGSEAAESGEATVEAAEPKRAEPGLPATSNPKVIDLDVAAATQPPEPVTADDDQ